jgi:beta-barrel assembly-enhancing protease
MKRFLVALISCVLSQPALAQSGPPPPSIYQPINEDERSLWSAMEEEERNIKNSRFLIKDTELNAYIRGVLCKTVSESKCGAARIYLMRTPQFNASMSPNGMMVVWSGLLLRTRNEAELASVLGHEFAHFEKQHSLKSFVNLRSKTNALKMLSYIPYVGVVGQIGVISSIFTFSREMEYQADIASVEYLKSNGYDANAAAAIWEQLRAEMDATAAERKLKSQKDNNGGFFATHPNSGERMEYLRVSASKSGTNAKQTNAEAYRKAIAPYWPMLIDDQIKLNDFGATQFLLTRDGNKELAPEMLYASGELYRSRGKKEDLVKAADYYRQSIKAGGSLPENWRGLGLSLIRSGQLAEGRNALRTYLSKRPDAPDHSMIEMMASGS